MTIIKQETNTKAMTNIVNPTTVENCTKLPEVSKENFVCDDKVYILGNFDRSISSEVIPGLMNIITMKRNTVNPVIEIYINSHGGSAYELFGLMSVIDIGRLSGIKFITYNLGIAASCGSLLAVYGDHRYMSKYATNLMHLGQAGSMFSTFKQMERQNENNKKHFNKIIDIYAASTKINKKKITELLTDDSLYLDPKQCLKYGLCDKVF